MSTTHKTKALVLRVVPYGETSLIITALTELFGLQSYIIKGVRKSNKMQTAKAVFFQPAAILEMVVYHHPLKQLNFVKEYKWATIYQHIYSDIFKNAIALYTVELLGKCVKQPEDHPELFYFAVTVMQTIDQADEQLAANLPLYFALQLPQLLGLQITDNFDEDKTILDLKEGCFCPQLPSHEYFVANPHTKWISTFLRAHTPDAIRAVGINGAIRKQLLESMEIFYQLHIPDFGKIKSLPILHEILS